MIDLKDIARKTLNFLHLDLTKNLEYDRLTKKIIKQVVRTNSNCIDVGCHKGEILDEIISSAPNAYHFAFEPIPLFFENLKTKYNNYNNITFLPFALASWKRKFTGSSMCSSTWRRISPSAKIPEHGSK
ncbi:MAG: hypothetical protein ACOYNH_12510 [Bacteroidia bacterium]